MYDEKERLDICGEVLKVARGGANKTKIVYQANLNFKIVEKYLTRLENGDLLREKAGIYVTTSRGSRFLEQYSLLINSVSLV